MYIFKLKTQQCVCVCVCVSGYASVAGALVQWLVLPLSVEDGHYTNSLYHHHHYYYYYYYYY